MRGKNAGDICGKGIKDPDSQIRCHAHHKCPHNRQKSRCRECGGSQICPHKRRRSTCKICGGSQICEHNRRRPECKECGGSSICEHNRVRSQCKECGGSSICEHNRQKSTCKECGGSQICEHNRQKSTCKECGGSQICEHNRVRSECKECGGSSICEHNRVRSICKECGGSQICEHNRERRKCKICDPNGYLTNLVRCRTRRALMSANASKDKRTLEYLSCTVQEYRMYIQYFLDTQIVPDGRFEMTWANQGDVWHIDHIIPMLYKPTPDFVITLDETIRRLHFRNTQPLYADMNIAKGNRFIG